MTTIATIGFLFTLCLVALVAAGELADRRQGATTRRAIRRAFAIRFAGFARRG